MLCLMWNPERGEKDASLKGKYQGKRGGEERSLKVNIMPSNLVICKLWKWYNEILKLY